MLSFVETELQNCLNVARSIRINERVSMRKLHRTNKMQHINGESDRLVRDMQYAYRIGDDPI